MRCVREYLFRALPRALEGARASERPWSLSFIKTAVPLQAWSGPDGSRKLRFPDFMTTAQDGGKVVSLTHWPPLPPGNTPGTHFCWRLSRPQGHSATGRIISLKFPWHHREFLKIIYALYFLNYIHTYAHCCNTIFSCLGMVVPARGSCVRWRQYLGIEPATCRFVA